MTDLIVVLILAVILGGAVRYIYKAKKRGVKCIGCPDADSCASCKSACGCSSSCSGCASADRI